MGESDKFSVVNIRSNENLKYWAEKFGATTGDVRKAAGLVGPSPERVGKYLRAAGSIEKDDERQ
jgi:hypothetical protein